MDIDYQSVALGITIAVVLMLIYRKLTYVPPVAPITVIVPANASQPTPFDSQRYETTAPLS